NTRDAPSDRRAATRGDEALRVSHQRGARVAGGRARACRGTRAACDRWRSARCRRRGAATAGKPALVARKRLHHAAYQRGKRSTLGPSDGAAARNPGAVVQRPGTAESRGPDAWLLNMAEPSQPGWTRVVTRTGRYEYQFQGRVPAVRKGQYEEAS